VTEKSDYNKTYWLKNKKRLTKQHKIYVKNHRAELLEYYRKYNKKHAAKKCAYDKRYAVVHKESVRAYQRQYAKEHASEKAEYIRTAYKEKYGISSVCRICEKSFLSDPREIKRGNGKLCSHSCSGIYRIMCYPNPESSLERTFKKALESRNIQFFQEHLIKEVPVLADFFIPPWKVVFLDGLYWHRPPKIKEKDGRITAALLGLGFEVYRIQETKQGILDPIQFRGFFRNLNKLP
jgi:hypothetical protein